MVHALIDIAILLGLLVLAALGWVVIFAMLGVGQEPVPRTKTNRKDK